MHHENLEILFNATNEIPQDLKADYNGKLGLWKNSESGFNIYIFSIIFKNNQEILDTWNNISKDIALHFQSNLKIKISNIERWNIYIFYLIEGIVEKQLIYTIENDKFSARKIVVDNLKKKTDMKDIREIIRHKLFNYRFPLSAKQRHISLSEKLNKYPNLRTFIERNLKVSQITNKSIDELLTLINNRGN